jgi:hypothetical protein
VIISSHDEGVSMSSLPPPFRRPARPHRRFFVAGTTIAWLLWVALLPGIEHREARGQTSRLWGTSGERWTPMSRLPDFSMAGYRRGEEPYRIPAQQVSVTEFGARGDDQSDDTPAFKKAIAQGRGKVITIPAGRYLLSDILEIRSSNLVLRGAGPDETVLIFTKSLEQIRPRPAKTDGNQPTTGWSWGGGLFMIGPSKLPESVAIEVVAEANRGSQQLSIAEPNFAVGESVVLTVRDDKNKSLVEYLYRGQQGNVAGLNNWSCRQVFRVIAKERNRIILDRPLRFDVRPGWNPTVAPFEPTVTDVGLEEVAFEFPAQQYGGHFREVGFNPVEIGSSAAHCWLRNIKVWNADSGPYVRGTFCTLEGIHLGADSRRQSSRGKYTGHHGISLYGYDCLCTNFKIETRFIHDLTVQSAMGCVFCSGRAMDLNMDHHRWAPYENLFSDIDAGVGRRLFSSSGGGHRGAHTAAGATFWNIRTEQPVGWPKNLGIDTINVIGIKSRDPERLDPHGRWLEPLDPGNVEPPELYHAMRRKRVEQRKRIDTRRQQRLSGCR